MENFLRDVGCLLVIALILLGGLFFFVIGFTIEDQKASDEINVISERGVDFTLDSIYADTLGTQVIAY